MSNCRSQTESSEGIVFQDSSSTQTLLSNHHQSAIPEVGRHAHRSIRLDDTNRRGAFSLIIVVGRLIIVYV